MMNLNVFFAALCGLTAICVAVYDGSQIACGLNILSCALNAMCAAKCG